MPAIVRLVPCLSDNYAVLLHDDTSGVTAIIDAPEAAPIIAAAEAEGWTPSMVLVTHHHADHVQAIPELKARYDLTIVGPKAEGASIPDLDIAVSDGDEVKVGALVAQVLSVPGHTAGHAVYLFASEQLLFAGDTLFSLGCGRPFECPPAVLWHSLERLRKLPDDVRLYCGHEYTQANARFALSVDPGNDMLKTMAQAIDARRAAAEPTLPSLLGLEKQTNPFLRADDAALAARLGLAGAAAEEVFAELRARKNNFRG
ncbi:hydroxyacylglutathione hydrolase [Xanthobacter sp. TB0139]|uniref:hydroxyacylglutathione hydrolase n=1 Tax=Xanthobacter sp. TB0139 TaxID=3459178 RepID=UPI0040392F6F